MMQCKKNKKIKIEQQNQDIYEDDIVNQLEFQNEMTKNCCEFFNIYEEAMLQQQFTIQNFNLYSNNNNLSNNNNFQEYKKSNSSTGSFDGRQSLNLLSDIQEQRQRASSEIEVLCFSGNKGNSQILQRNQSVSIQKQKNSQNNNNTKKQILGILEGNDAILQQNIEELQKQLKDQKKFTETIQDKLSASQKQNQKLQNTLSQTEEALIEAKIEISELKEIQDNNLLTINQLSEENKSFIDKLQIEQLKYDELVSRMLQEKQQIIEKINMLNKEQEELQMKNSMLKEKEEYFQNQKLQFHQNVKNSGQTSKLPSVAPQMTQVMADMVNNSSGPPTQISKRKFKFHSSEIYNIVSSTNGNMVATCSGDRYINIYDPYNDIILGRFQGIRAQQVYTDIAFSPYNNYLLAGTTDNLIQIFNCNPSKKLADYLGHSQKINCVKFVSDKTRFVSSSEDKTIKIWDLQKKQVIKSISPGSNCKTISDFSAEPHIITGHENGSVKMYSIKDGKLIYNIQDVYDDQITNVKVTSCGNNVVISSSYGEVIKILDVRQTKTVLHELYNNNYSNGHDYNKVSLGPEEQWVIGGSSGGSVHFWDLKYNQKNNKIIDKTQHEGTVICSYFHQGSGLLYTGDSKGNLFIWN